MTTDTLGLKRAATKGEIKAAYFELAKKYHPDINPSPGAKAKFEKIVEAYEVLSNQSEKVAYDSKMDMRGGSWANYQQHSYKS